MPILTPDTDRLDSTSTRARALTPACALWPVRPLRALRPKQRADERERSLPTYDAGRRDLNVATKSRGSSSCVFRVRMTTNSAVPGIVTVFVFWETDVMQRGDDNYLQPACRIKIQLSIQQ